MALRLNSERGFIFSYLLCLNTKWNNVLEPDHTFINSGYEKLQRSLILAQNYQISDRPVHAKTIRRPESLSKEKNKKYKQKKQRQK